MKPKEELLEDLKQTVINYDEEDLVRFFRFASHVHYISRSIRVTIRYFYSLIGLSQAFVFIFPSTGTSPMKSRDRNA